MRADAPVSLLEARMNELFAMTFTGAGFQRYQAFLSPDNPYAYSHEVFLSWGMGLRLGILLGAGHPYSFHHAHKTGDAACRYSREAAARGGAAFVARMGLTQAQTRTLYRFIYQGVTHYSGGSSGGGGG